MNWGNKLLLTFIVFAAGMGYMVYRSLSTNYELVSKDYYNQELRYQQVIDGSNLANQLSSQVRIEQTKEGIHLALPPEMKNKSVTGNILFYCAYDEKKDRKYDLTLSPEGTQLFAAAAIHPGTYIVKVNWDAEGKNYFTEKKLIVL